MTTAYELECYYEGQSVCAHEVKVTVEKKKDRIK
jgi:hypothetical protein